MKKKNRPCVVTRSPLALMVGKRVKAWMEKKGHSQTELAAILQVSQATVSRWLSGRDLPSVECFRDLAKVMGTTMEKLAKASQKS